MRSARFRSLLLMIACVALGAAADAAPRAYADWGYEDADWTTDVAGWKPLAAGEHPRLIFRAEDLPRLKRRAESAEGERIVARVRAILDGPFTLWHPAGNAFLWQLTGERAYADRAKAQLEEILDKGRKDRDDRYGFANPGSGGAMRSGPAIGAVGLAYDLGYGAWDEAFRAKVAGAIMANTWTAGIVAKPPIMASCNHWGAAVGGVGIGLLALRGDPGVDGAKVEAWLAQVAAHARREIAIGYGDRGYYFEGHQCGRISSNTGLIPFVQAYRVAAGKDMVAGKENARWLAAKWIYEFARNPDGSYTNPQRGMYCRDFPRGGMYSQHGDFCQGFGICPTELVPALKWVHDNQVEPGEKTWDVLDYPHLGIYALMNWPFDVPAQNPAETLPRVMHDTGAGYVAFRNGWSEKGDDIMVTVLMGTHGAHKNGRGMSGGGHVYVVGKGLGFPKGEQGRANCRLPIPFHGMYPTHADFRPDGSGTLSAMMYPDWTYRVKQGPKAAVDRSQPTALAVDFGKSSGADLLCAIAGPLHVHDVGYWIEMFPPTEPKDVPGQDGYSAKFSKVQFAGKVGWIMTLAKSHPAVRQEGDQVVVGGQTISFDGKAMKLAK